MGNSTFMSDFAAALQDRLSELRRQGLFRELRRIDSPQQVRLQVEDGVGSVLDCNSRKN